MRKRVFAVLAVLLSLVTPILSAPPVVFESEETPATLVELFTSEGCSSCPPAETWLSGLKDNPDLWKHVVPVAFHVDYWNNLGWTDRFSTPENTARQRRYAVAWNGDSVYTPGLVLNGREWRDWFERRSLPKPSSEKVGKLTVTVGNAEVEVTFTGVKSVASPGRLVAEVAFLAGNLESGVTRGENRGRKLQHDFTVVGFASAPMQVEGASHRVTLPRPEKYVAPPDAVAAWVVTAEAQPPLQATGGWLTAR